MDSQSTVDHLRDEADARRDTTLGDLLDTAAEELDEAQEEVRELRAEVERLKASRDRWKRATETAEDNMNYITRQERGA